MLLIYSIPCFLKDSILILNGKVVQNDTCTIGIERVKQKKIQTQLTCCFHDKEQHMKVERENIVRNMNIR